MAGRRDPHTRALPCGSWTGCSETGQTDKFFFLWVTTISIANAQNGTIHQNKKGNLAAMDALHSADRFQGINRGGRKVGDDRVQRASIPVGYVALNDLTKRHENVTVDLLVLSCVPYDCTSSIFFVFPQLQSLWLVVQKEFIVSYTYSIGFFCRKRPPETRGTVCRRSRGPRSVCRR